MGQDRNTLQADFSQMLAGSWVPQISNREDLGTQTYGKTIQFIGQARANNILTPIVGKAKLTFSRRFPQDSNQFPQDSLLVDLTYKAAGGAIGPIDQTLQSRLGLGLGSVVRPYPETNNVIIDLPPGYHSGAGNSFLTNIEELQNHGIVVGLDIDQYGLIPGQATFLAYQGAALTRPAVT